MTRPVLTPYPLALEPRLYRRVWGGDRLVGLHAGRLPDPLPTFGPAGEPVGESWLAGDDSVIANGALRGRSVAQAVRELGAGLVGSVAWERYGARMPLLAKFLDAAAPLSIQVHPDDDYALRAEAATGHLGKSEAWYVLAAEPGATVLWGFQRDLTQAELRHAVDAGSFPELMHRVPVAAGDVIVNPAGTVHAVGAGVQLFEIQQASDLTYRIYDYGRLGADGRPRELHLEKALAVADLTGSPFAAPRPRPLAGGWERLVERQEFVLDRREVTGETPARGAVAPSSLELLTVTRGSVTLAPDVAAGAPWEALELAAGQTALLPAALAGGYELRGAGEVLRSAVANGAERDAGGAGQARGGDAGASERGAAGAAAGEAP